jgi:hypothetical protein
MRPIAKELQICYTIRIALFQWLFCCRRLKIYHLELKGYSYIIGLFDYPVAIFAGRYIILQITFYYGEL